MLRTQRLIQFVAQVLVRVVELDVQATVDVQRRQTLLVLLELRPCLERDVESYTLNLQVALALAPIVRGSRRD